MAVPTFQRIGTLSVTTMMRKCCQNCHFLAKEIVNDAGTRHRWSWDQRERSELRLKEHCAAQCAQGVWDTGIDPHLNAQLPKILLKQRGDSCFFLAAQSGMSFPAAEKLIELQNLKKSYWYARTALWISLISAVVAAIAMVLSSC